VVSGDPAATEREHGRTAIDPSPARVAASVRRADAVVVGGGTVFKQLGRTVARPANALLRNTAALIAAARASATPVAMVGVGAGELRGAEARALCRWIAPRADLLVLRDEESASVLARAGVSPPFWIGADPVWSLYGDHRPAELGERRSLTVAISHHGIEPAAVDALAATLRPLAGEWNIRLQPWQSGAGMLDHQLALSLQAQIGCAEVIDPPRDLDDAVRTFATDRLVIGLRFHALVAGALAGARLLALASEPKHVGLARRLEQASVPPHTTEPILRSTVAWALRNEPASAQLVRREIVASAHGLEMLELLLRGGAVKEPQRLPAMALASGVGRW
jgi:polysaccharide pyruvyl transferase WcaK-like protein